MSRPKVVSCSCGKGFGSVSALKMHIMAIHKGDQPAPPAPQPKREGWLKRVFKKIFRKG